MTHLPFFFKFRWTVSIFILLFTAAPAVNAQEITLAQAVQKTFQDNPYIQIEKEMVTSARGDYQSALGEFDWIYFLGASVEHTDSPISESSQSSREESITSQNEQISTINAATGSSLDLVDVDIPDDFQEDIITLQTGVGKKLKNGITLTPSVSLRDYESSTSSDPVNRSDVRLKIVVPTLRGAGTEAATADSAAAASALETARLSSFHNISKDIHTTIIAFWNCLAARQSFALVQESFQRSDKLFTNVTNMVTAGLLEPAFINQAQAQLYNTRVDVKNGEISLYETRQALGLSMGMTSEALMDPPRSSGKFPRPLTASAVKKMVPRLFIRTAKEKRMDYHAALENIKASKILLTQAKNVIKPKLDLTFQVGYAGLSEGGNRYWNALHDNINGMYGYAGLDMELPLENNYAKGRYHSRAAAVTMAGLSADAAFNAISSEVYNALEKIKILVSQHDLAAKSATRYKAAVAFEKKKYDAGESTLNALIDIEDRYIDAQLTVIETIRKYAIALTNLKFVTGTLLDRNNDDLHFNPRHLLGRLE